MLMNLKTFAVLALTHENREFDERSVSYTETVFLYLLSHLKVQENELIKNIGQASKEGGKTAKKVDTDEQFVKGTHKGKGLI